jgi:cytochrome bd-type quinol oxidase subunit 2
MHRECDRYGLDAGNVAAVVAGEDPLADHKHPRRWWEVLIMCLAAAVFVWLAAGTRAQHIYVNVPWMIVLIAGTIVPLGLCGSLLWKRTRFS